MNPHCPECGMKPGYGYQPSRGLDCETCAQYLEDVEIEREIDEAIENKEEIYENEN